MAPLGAFFIFLQKQNKMDEKERKSLDSLVRNTLEVWRRLDLINFQNEEGAGHNSLWYDRYGQTPEGYMTGFGQLENKSSGMGFGREIEGPTPPLTTGY